MKKTFCEHNLQTGRRFVAYFSGMGLSGTLLPGVLWAKLQEKRAPAITIDMVKDAARVAGLDCTTEECQMIAVARAYQNATDFHTKHPPLKLVA